MEGYEDFIKAITYVAPVSVSFEDIPGDSKGFFSPVKWRRLIHANIFQIILEVKVDSIL